MRLLYIFLGLAILFLIPFLIWGEGFEAVFSQEGTVTWLHNYAGWAWSVAILLLIMDLFLPIPATAIMVALGSESSLRLCSHTSRYGRIERFMKNSG